MLFLRELLANVVRFLCRAGSTAREAAATNRTSVLGDGMR